MAEAWCGRRGWNRLCLNRQRGCAEEEDGLVMAKRVAKGVAALMD